jgi:hypothetical protein
MRIAMPAVSNNGMPKTFEGASGAEKKILWKPATKTKNSCRGEFGFIEIISFKI